MPLHPRAHRARIAALAAVIRRPAQVLAVDERRYRDLYEDSPDMHLTVELPSGRTVDVNRTLCDRLGYERDALIGKPAIMLYGPDFKPTDGGHAELQRTGELVDVERELRCRDGSTIAVSLNLRAIRDASGQIVRARAVWRDISKRKEAERDRLFLLHLGDLSRDSTDVTDAMARLCTELGRYLGVAQCRFAEIDVAHDKVVLHRGYHRDGPATAGTLALNSFARETRDQNTRGETVVLEDATSDPRTAYAVNYKATGTRSAIAVPLMRAGAWIASLVVSHDQPRRWDEREVTLMKLVAERAWLWIEHLRLLADLRSRDVADAIHKTEARYQVLVDGVKEYAVYMLDRDGNVATWNSGAERLKGYRLDEIVGSHVSRLLPEADVEHARTMLERAVSAGRYEEEGWHVRKDGSRFWASLVISPIYAPDGSLEGFASVVRDFTEHERHAAELRAKQAALTQALKEREVLLQEVHHRVKNNLQVISSLINMQMRMLEHGASRDALEECQLRVLAIALIHEKLYQSKDYSQVRFADYARSLASNVFHAVGVSQSHVSLELSIDEIPLGVDRAIPCGLVINELITNALKHGFKDGRTGRIRVELVTVADGKLKLTVEDDGIGLPAGFDIRTTGSMGLQLVCTLAEQLDAVLVVRGDGGCSFQLTFPGSAHDPD